MDLTLAVHTEPRVCAYCHDALGLGLSRCPLCAAAYHVECLPELRRCATLGCPGELPTGATLPTGTSTPATAPAEEGPRLSLDELRERIDAIELLLTDDPAALHRAHRGERWRQQLLTGAHIARRILPLALVLAFLLPLPWHVLWPVAMGAWSAMAVTCVALWVNQDAEGRVMRRRHEALRLHLEAAPRADLQHARKLAAALEGMPARVAGHRHHAFRWFVVFSVVALLCTALLQWNLDALSFLGLTSSGTWVSDAVDMQGSRLGSLLKLLGLSPEGSE